MHKHTMGSNWVGIRTAEKGLGLLVDHKLNMSQQCDKANIILECNKKICKTQKVIVPLYSARMWSSVSSSVHHTSGKMWTN